MKKDPWKNRPENRERNNATTRARMAARRLENPEQFREERRRWELKRKYDLSPELKQALVDIQDGVCSICGTPIDAVSCATDHCHIGNYVRGMLCRQCNSALGLFKDSPEIIRRAADYLEASRTILEEPTTEDFAIADALLTKAYERRSTGFIL